jgi:hypothetical protein
MGSHNRQRFASRAILDRAAFCCACPYRTAFSCSALNSLFRGVVVVVVVVGNDILQRRLPIRQSIFFAGQINRSNGSSPHRLSALPDFGRRAPLDFATDPYPLPVIGQERNAFLDQRVADGCYNLFPCRGSPFKVVSNYRGTILSLYPLNGRNPNFRSSRQLGN